MLCGWLNEPKRSYAAVEVRSRCVRLERLQRRIPGVTADDVMIRVGGRLRKGNPGPATKQKGPRKGAFLFCCVAG